MDVTLKSSSYSEMREPQYNAIESRTYSVVRLERDDVTVDKASMMITVRIVS